MLGTAVSNISNDLSLYPERRIRMINQPLALEPHDYRALYSDTMRSVAKDLAAWIELTCIFRGIELPRASVVLGSGLSTLTSQLEIVSRLRFRDCGLPSPSADGHAGEFLLAAHEGRGVLLQSGRIHCYESWSPAVVALSVRAQALAGIRTFILTNAAGGLDPDISIGDLVLLTGHHGAENHSPSKSLYDDGKGDTGPFGPKFYPVNDIYSPQLRSRFMEIADGQEVAIHAGIYQFMEGPRYEETNEIRSFMRQRTAALADGTPEDALIAVGMSTAPEAYALAQLRCHPRFSDLRMLGISNITNKAAGIGGSVPTSEEVLEAGPIGGAKIAAIVRELLPEL
jgi:purine-nucleoside phosphorylase